MKRTKKKKTMVVSSRAFFILPFAFYLFPFAFILLVGPLFACRQTDRPGPNNADLTIMANAAKDGVNSQMAEWLEEEIPGLEQELGVKIRFLPAGLNDQDYKARIALDIKAGRGADVIDIDQFWAPEFAAAGFIRSLDQYFQTWSDKDQFFPPILQMGTFEGHVYQVIWNADVRMIFYNRDLLQSAGVAVPWQPTSWQDLIDAGRAIKARHPDVTPIQLDAGTAMDEATTMQGFYMVLRGAGGRLHDPERGCWIAGGEPLHRALDFYRQLYQEEKLADPDLQVAPKAREKSFSRFAQEKIAIYVESTWFYASVLDPQNPSWGMADRDRKVLFAKMPGGGRPGDPPFVSISGGDGLIISPDAKNPELAWRLLAGLNRIDRQKRLFAKKPFTPTRRDLADSADVKAHQFIARAAGEIMPYTSFRPALREYPEISFHVQYLTERVATGQLSVEAAIAEFRKAVANVVGEDKVCAEEK